MKINKNNTIIWICIILAFVSLLVSIVAINRWDNLISDISSANDFNPFYTASSPYFGDAEMFEKTTNFMTSTVYAIQESYQTIEQKIIRTAEIKYEVKNYESSRLNIENIVKKNNSYIASEKEERDEYTIKNNIVVRVPSEYFFSLIDSFLVESINLNSKNINSQDVTEQFVDTQARLKTKREIEKRYLNILNRANKVADILNIEEQLGNTREEIEATESKLNSLKNRIAYSTINLKIYQKIKDVGKSKSRFFSKFSRAFSQGWSSIIALIVFIISLWPFILIFIILFTIYLRSKKARK